MILAQIKRLRTFLTQSTRKRLETEDAAPGPEAKPEIKLGEDVKAAYPEQWQQDAILRAWRTGKPTIGEPPSDA